MIGLKFIGNNPLHRKICPGVSNSLQEVEMKSMFEG